MKETIKTPPYRNNFVPVVHVVKEIYKNIYKIGNSLSKRDKLGIHKHIEEISLLLFDNILEAVFSHKTEKIKSLEKARMLIEKLKNLIRLEYEEKILSQKQYIQTESLLVECSKMINGWIKYLTQNPV